METEREIKDLYCLMEDILDYDGIAEFLKCSIDEIWINHFSMGLWLRNNVLNDGNAICRDFIRNGVTSKDEMSNALLEGFYRYLQSKEPQKQ